MMSQMPIKEAAGFSALSYNPKAGTNFFVYKKILADSIISRLMNVVEISFKESRHEK